MNKPVPVNCFAPGQAHAKQLEVLNDPARFKILRAGRKWNKCEYEDTYLSVIIDGTPSIVQAKKLLELEKFEVYSLGEDTKYHKAQAFAADNGIKKVYRVTTRSGRSAEVTANHPLLTITGWKKVKDLTVGDPIAIPTLYPEHGKRTIDDNIVKVVAYLLGDGGVTQNNPIFSQENNPQLKEFKDCIKKLGGTVKKINEYDWRINGLNDLWRELGIIGYNSHTKFIPQLFTELNRYQTSIFLSRLFSTDGCYSVHKNKQRVLYTSVSFNLIKQIQLLLLRFGISARVYRRAIKSGYVYTLNITRENDLYNFSRQIGIKGKLKKQTKIIERKFNKPSRLTRYGFKHLAYDPIKTIEYIGKQRTIAIEVPEYKNYISSVIEHNTSLGVSWLFEGALQDTQRRKFAFILPFQTQARDSVWNDHVARVLDEFDRKKVPYKKNESTMEITLPNGATFKLYGSDNEKALRSISNLGRVVVDEYDDCSPSLWNLTLRPNLIVHRAPAIIMGTPKGKKNMYKLELESQQFKAFHYTSYDNPRLSQEELEELENEYKQQGDDVYMQEIMAEYRKPTGVVFPEFNVTTHVVEPFEIPEHWDMYRSIDLGETNPTAVAWIAVDPKGNWYIVDELYETGLLTKDYVEMMQIKTGKRKIRGTVLDENGLGKQLLLDWNFYGARAIGQKHMKIMDGVARIREKLRVDELTGKPKLFIFKGKCPNLIMELENFRYKESKLDYYNAEGFEKGFDHLISCLRNLAVTFFYAKTKDLTPETQAVRKNYGLEDYDDDWDLN